MSGDAELQLVVSAAGGSVRLLYSELLDLRELGEPRVERASHVEPDAQGFWWADLSPVAGPLLGPFSRRSQALHAESAWLLDHYLSRTSPSPV
jgi:hypothetical protein